MQLSPKDIELFYKLFHSLLVYINEKHPALVGLNSRDDFPKFPLEEISNLRDKLYEHPDLMDSFIEENPFGFSPEELDIIRSWHHFVQGSFYIFRYLKKYTIFLGTEEPAKAFGVIALNSTFEEMVGKYLPIMAEAVLLPFKNQIIYDSLFAPYQISFGGNIRRRMNQDYNRAKARFGIITSLPFAAEESGKSEVDLLKFYLKNEQNREEYWEEIDELIAKDAKLLVVYHQEMGKIYARTYGRQLRKIGLKNAWFGILEGITIASGSTKKEVQQVLDRILPEEKRDFVYMFQLKGK